MKIANRQAQSFVERRQRFDGSHLFARHERAGVYVVYSYGYHFPIYAHIDGVWYANCDKYSVSTSRHQSQARPIFDTVKVGTDELKNLVAGRVNVLA